MDDIPGEGEEDFWKRSVEPSSERNQKTTAENGGDDGASGSGGVSRNRCSPDDNAGEIEQEEESEGSDQDDFNFNCDAESVGSDELEKLKMEAGDLGDFAQDDDEEDGSNEV